MGRIKNQELARVVPLEELAKQGESKDVVFARIEAYARCGAIIDIDDLKQVTETYKFSKDDYDKLGKAYNEGMREGVIMEPDNLVRSGERLGNFVYCFEQSKIWGDENEKL